VHHGRVSNDSHEQRLARARVALRGLSVGDAFGERFFFASPQTMVDWIERRAIDRPGPWRWTDDTAMPNLTANGMPVTKKFLDRRR